MCAFCEDEIPIHWNDSFYVTVEDKGVVPKLCIDYESYWEGYDINIEDETELEINFCPMCGEKLHNREIKPKESQSNT